ncbi:MAG: hypothetical protein SFT92_02300 [Rickettsiales bacterium]|nr:hypothetical protein [Rickettsiales bacterium]
MQVTINPGGTSIAAITQPILVQLQPTYVEVAALGQAIALQLEPTSIDVQLAVNTMQVDIEPLVVEVALNNTASPGGSGSVTLTGDASGSGTGSIAVTLANSGVSAGSYGSATQVPVVTFDSKGRATGASNTSIAIASSAVTDFATAADARITAQKGAASGLATLDGSSKIPTSQLPAIALTDVFVVASQVAQLALTAEEGDVAVRTDLNKSYVHNGGTAGTMADWQELLTPSDAVLSVNGQTGTVSLTTSNISEGSNLYFTQARVSANTDVAANTAARHNAVTIGTANGLSLSTQQISLAAANTSTTGALTSTDWNTFNNKQSALTLGNLSGTTNQINASATRQVVGGSLTLSLPQDIHTGASPTFANATLSTSMLFSGAGSHYIKHNSGSASTDKIILRNSGNTDQFTFGMDGLYTLRTATSWWDNDATLFEYGNDTGVAIDGTPIGLYWSNGDIGNNQFELRTRGGTYQNLQVGYMNAIYYSGSGGGLTSLNASNVSTGTLAVARGGTGLGSLTANYIPYGNGTSAFQSSANFTYNGTTLNVLSSGGIGIGTSSTQGVISMDSTTANRLEFGTAGTAAPGSSSVGMKLKLYGPDGAMNSTDYAVGIAGGSMWFNSGAEFDFWVNASTRAFGWDTGANCFYIGDPSPPTYARLHVESTSNPIMVLEDSGDGVGYLYQNATVTGFGAETSFDWKTGISFATGPVSSGTSRLSLSGSLMQAKVPFQTIDDVTFTLGDVNKEWLIDYDSTSASDTPITWQMDVTGANFGFTFTGHDWNINNSWNAGNIYGVDLDIVSTGTASPPQLIGYTVDFSAGASNTNFNKCFAGSVSGTNITYGAAIYGSANNAANTNTFLSGKYAGYFDGRVLSVAPSDFNLVLADNISNSTLKQSAVVAQHYTNSEEPMGILYTYNNNLLNLLRYGGGNSTLNATTQQEWYTAANATTVTGTRRGYVNSSGNWVFGNTSDGAGNGTVNIERNSNAYTYDQAGIAIGYATESTSNAFITYMGYNSTTSYGFIDAVQISMGYKDMCIVPNGGKFIVGNPGNATLKGAKLEIVGSSSIPFVIQVPRGNDDNKLTYIMPKIVTSSATTTTIYTYATTTNSTTTLDITVDCVRSAGTAGSAVDGGSWNRKVRVKNVSGTVTINGGAGPVDITVIHEDIAGFTVEATTSGSNMLLRVTGAANNTISWYATIVETGPYTTTG